MQSEKKQWVRPELVKLDLATAAAKLVEAADDQARLLCAALALKAAADAETSRQRSCDESSDLDAGKLSPVHASGTDRKARP